MKLRLKTKNNIFFALFIIFIMAAATFLTLGQNGFEKLYLASAACFIVSIFLFRKFRLK